MSEKTKQEPGVVRTKKVEIELPEGLYDLLEKVCEVQDQSVNEFILEDLIVSLDSELQDNLGNHFGFYLKGGEYREYVESLARPEEAVQEAARV